jgi:hypothetical protein
MGTLAAVRTRALASLIPPPRLHLSEWIEPNIRLPEADCHDCVISDIEPSSQSDLPPLPGANGRICLHFVLLVTLLVAKPASPK